MPFAPRGLFFAAFSGFVLTFPGLAARAQAPAAAASEPHFPSNEELRHLRSVSDPRLSPDGKQVVFVVAEPTAEGGKTHLWLASVGERSGEFHQLTFASPADKRGERDPQWAADSSSVYFLAKRGEQTGLFRLDLRGGDAAPLEVKVLPAVDDSKIAGVVPPAGAENADQSADQSSDGRIPARPAEKKPEAAPEPLPLDLGGYALAPDGVWLAVWGRDPETPGEKKQKDAKADATWVDHEAHGTRLYLAALKHDGTIDGALKVVHLDVDVRAVVWNPAGDKMLVVNEKPNGAADLGPARAGWLVEAKAPEKATKLDGIPATIGRGAAWRADGAELAFTAQTPEDAPPGYDELFALSLAAGAGPARRLSAGFAGQINGSGLVYGLDGSVVAEAAVGTRITPIQISANGKEPKPVTLTDAIVEGLNTNPKQTGWVWLAGAGGEEEKLCYAAKFGDACQLVSLPPLAPANLRWAKPELVSWKSGAFTVEGLLYLPPASGAKTPLVIDVHGGPFGAFEDRNDPFVAFLLGQGWAVLRPNPRGSSNYGVAFGAANKNDLGGGDYRDVMAGVDAVLAKYPIDSSRMALIGYSYGGEMAGFVEGKTDRFKAIVSAAPVIDQFSEYGTEGESWYDRWYFGKPWEHRDDAWRQSPLSGAAHAKTPLLLIQGDSDTTDPLGQSQEMYRALRQEGVPVEMATYPRENHGPLAVGIFGRPSPEPWHGFDARQRIVEFIAKAFQGVGH